MMNENQFIGGALKIDNLRMLLTYAFVCLV